MEPAEFFDIFFPPPLLASEWFMFTTKHDDNTYNTLITTNKINI